MTEELKKLLSSDLEEIKQHKIRVIALGVCAVALLIFVTVDENSGEEINLNEPTEISKPVAKDLPVTKDLPAKPLPVEKNSEGVTLVMGANADALTVGNPFLGEEKINPPKPATPILIQPPAIPQAKSKEKISLTGTAISGGNKTAMFLRDKETIFLTIGDELNGRRIVDITPDFVTFADGGRVYVQNGVK